MNPAPPVTKTVTVPLQPWSEVSFAGVCGIAGAVGSTTSPSPEDVVRRQLRLLEHRGPDASGVYSAGGGTIGQTRLAVIDLVTGDPPVTSEQGRVAAVLNGEIYNYRELRQALVRDGHVLTTRGDTEVIAHLAEEREPADLARDLDGMFAFAVWDTSRRRLVLGRDRMGKKPLYYWSDGDSIVFASEIKALLVHPDVPRRMDGAALPAYLVFGYVPTPQTFFEGVRSIPPAHVLVFEPGSPPRLEKYWEPLVPAEGAHAGISLGEAAAAVRTTLSAAVERRLISDVPVGAFLSGGLDSSAVVALMAGHARDRFATFTIGFDNDQGFDERPYARAVADRFGTQHTELVVKPDTAHLIERLVWHHDQPFGDSSALPTFLLSELAAKQVKVVLSGDGGDELFAGYERFAAARLLSGIQRWPKVAQEATSTVVKALSHHGLGGRVRGAERLLAARSLPFPDAFLSWVSFVPDSWRAELCPSGPEAALAGYRRVWAEHTAAGFLDRLLWLNMRTYLLDDLLPKVDRMGMAHGLEVRSPFLDTALVELALALPPACKLRALSGKVVLRRAVQDLVPPEVLRRRKHGFGLPIDAWFRAELRSYATQRLQGGGARVRAVVEPRALDRMVSEHLSGAADHGHSLWALLTLEEFLVKQGW